MKLVDKINGYGVVALRFVTTIIAGLILWLVTTFSGNLETISDNMVYKCDYSEDKEVLVRLLEKFDSRVTYLERARK